MAVMLTPLRAEQYTPTDWQLEDLQELVDKSFSANWSEMGCYKTTTGLWLIDGVTREIENPLVLIVTTKGGKGTYFDAVPKTLPKFRFFNIGTRKAFIRTVGDFEFPIDVDEFELKLNQAKDKPTIVLAHYHCFTNKSPIQHLLRQFKWDFILCDEAHRMKEKDTQWTRNIKQLDITENGHKHIMTGTGFINNPAEMWSPLNFLSRSHFRSYWQFRRYFCDEIEVAGFSKIIGVKPETEDEFIELRRKLGPRREMRKVHAGISEPIFNPVEVDLNPTQRKMYNSIRSELRALDQKGYPLHSPNVLSALQRMRQICVATPEVIKDYYDEKEQRRIQVIQLVEPSSKLDAVMELIDGMQWDAEKKQQVVIFSNFKDPIELLKARFEKKDISYIHMTASDSEATRYYKWHDVFPQKEHRVFLSTLQLGGESINLTPAEYCIFLDRSWSPKDNMQAVGRVYRPGQTGVVEVIHVNARQTTDQRIEHANTQKVNWFNLIFGEDD